MYVKFSVRCLCMTFIGYFDFQNYQKEWIYSCITDTMMFLDIIHRLDLYETQRFGDWIVSPPSTKPIQVQSVGLVPISGHLHQHKMGYTSQAEHKPSVRAKKIITILKYPHVWGLRPETFQNRSHHWRDKFSVLYQKSLLIFQLSLHWTLRLREARWERRPSWVDWSSGLSETCGRIPFYFLYVVTGLIYKTLASFQHIVTCLTVAGQREVKRVTTKTDSW
jgi:hypothetical protein